MHIEDGENEGAEKAPMPIWLACLLTLLIIFFVVAGSFLILQNLLGHLYVIEHFFSIPQL